MSSENLNGIDAKVLVEHPTSTVGSDISKMNCLLYILVSACKHSQSHQSPQLKLDLTCAYVGL